MFGVARIKTCEEVALITFSKIPLNLDLLSSIFGEFAKQNIVLDMISQTSPVGGHVSLSFTCSDSELVKVLGISKTLGGKYPQLKPLVSSGNCKILLYGEEMVKTPGVYAKAIAALAGTQVELEQVTTSDYDISLLVTNADLEEAVSALKTAFAL